MRKSGFLVIFIWITSVFLLVFNYFYIPPQKKSPFFFPTHSQLALITQNDAHGHYQEDKDKGEIGLINTIKLLQKTKETYPNTLFLDGGDNLAGNISANFFGGEPTYASIT